MTGREFNAWERVIPAEFDDIDDAVAAGDMTPEEAARAKASIPRFNVSTPTLATFPGASYTGGADLHADLEWAVAFTCDMDPDGSDAREAELYRLALHVLANCRPPAPYLSVEERNAIEAEERERKAARIRQAQTVQLTMFDEGAAPAVVYDEPTDHPEFETFAILLSEFAVWVGRWPRAEDFDSPPDGLTLPTLEQITECGGVKRTVEAAQLERPVAGVA